MNGMNELRSQVKYLMKLEDYNRTSLRESEVKFQLSKVTVLKLLLKSMAYINEQLSAPANWVVVINLKTMMFPNYNLRSRGKPFRFAALPTLNFLELLRGGYQVHYSFEILALKKQCLF
ncbi:hypothetical protein BC332_07484 [Capsicum chinense]|nr:hypothetical protein BC332_07484 [Capsicum chinense]